MMLRYDIIVWPCDDETGKDRDEARLSRLRENIIGGDRGGGCYAGLGVAWGKAVERFVIHVEAKLKVTTQTAKTRNYENHKIRKG